MNICEVDWRTRSVPEGTNEIPSSVNDSRQHRFDPRSVIPDALLVISFLKALRAEQFDFTCNVLDCMRVLPGWNIARDTGCPHRDFCGLLETPYEIMPVIRLPPPSFHIFTINYSRYPTIQRYVC